MTIVLDSNVYLKLVINESGSDDVVVLLEMLLTLDVPWIGPSLMLYEVLSTGIRSGVSFDATHGLLLSHRAAGLELVEPGADVLAIASRIARFGHPKSGYPSYYDSIYHALAIHTGGTLITADRRHIDKAESFGHILPLARWREAPAFADARH